MTDPTMTLLEQAREAIQFANNFPAGSPRAADAFNKAHALAAMAQAEALGALVSEASPTLALSKPNHFDVEGGVQAGDPYHALNADAYDFLTDDAEMSDGGTFLAAIRKDLTPDQVARLAGGMVRHLGLPELGFFDWITEQQGAPSMEPNRGTVDADNFDVVIGDDDVPVVPDLVEFDDEDMGVRVGILTEVTNGIGRVEYDGGGAKVPMTDLRLVSRAKPVEVNVNDLAEFEKVAAIEPTEAVTDDDDGEPAGIDDVFAAAKAEAAKPKGKKKGKGKS